MARGLKSGIIVSLTASLVLIFSEEMSTMDGFLARVTSFERFNDLRAMPAVAHSHLDFYFGKESGRISQGAVKIATRAYRYVDGRFKKSVQC